MHGLSTLSVEVGDVGEQAGAGVHRYHANAMAQTFAYDLWVSTGRRQQLPHLLKPLPRWSHEELQADETKPMRERGSGLWPDREDSRIDSGCGRAPV